MYVGDANSTKSGKSSGIDDESSTATVQVLAPFDLSGGYQFKMKVDGEIVNAQVPPNGARKGEMFFPLLEDNCDEETADVSTQSGSEFAVNKALADDLSSFGSVQQSVAPSTSKNMWKIIKGISPPVSPKSALRAAQQKVPIEVQNKIAIELAMQRVDQQRRKN